MSLTLKHGAYDKKVRDVEPIGDINDYYEKYPVFANYPAGNEDMTKIDETVGSIAKIKEICEENDVNLVVILSPVYKDYLEYFPKEKVKEFHRKIATVTPYWDFTTSIVSEEPRYFYDETHFRNSVGTMMLARIFDDKAVYVPDDFGEYITTENVDEYVENLWSMPKNQEYTKEVPILMYHSIVEEATKGTEVSKKNFEEQIKELKNNGYEAILVEDLIEYVYNGKELPEKPICITFDDGYLNNYDIAYPILKKYNMKATIFVIGSSIGATKNYKNTDYPITPHFNEEQAIEMEKSGVISIQSHTYDMHQWKPFECGEMIRENILKLDNETESDYIVALKEDIEKENNALKNISNVEALAYPSGKYDTLTNVVLNQNGIKLTLSVETGINTIIKGLPQSLYALKRFNVDDSLSGEDIVELIK